jgi:hypothetical protein
MMTQIEFRLLPQPEQLDVLYTSAVFIGKRKLGSTSVLLYQLEGFYVEVFYKKHRCCATKIHCFRSTEYLDPYLQQIELEPLVT